MRIKSLLPGAAASLISADSGKPAKVIKELPKPGDKLAWSGTSIYDLESLQRVQIADWPGILQPRRPLLPLLSPETGAVLPTCDTLVLDKAFQTVNWYGPQVFLAHIERSAHLKVVIKLMYMDAREPGENVNMDDFDFTSAKTLVKFAKSEADAYAALEKAQGSILPYCYGFYKFKLPNGNTCIGQVIEYVDGFPPGDYAKTLQNTIDDEKIDAFLTGLYKTLIELHKVGVVHKDQASRNIRLLYPLDPLHPRFVIFDFGYAILAKDWVANTDPMLRDNCSSDGHTHPRFHHGEDHWLKMDEDRMKWFMDECGKGVRKSGWEKTKKGKELIALWKTHPDELTEEQKIPAWFDEISEKVKAKL